MKKILSQFGQKPLIRKETGSLVQQEQIKSQITVIPEFESLIPPLTKDEYEQLEGNIIRDGCREPLLIWNTTQHVLYNNADNTSVYVLIDGHNRYGICQRNGLDFKISLREFDDKEAVRSFMIDNQLGRRNLTPEQMAYLRGLKYLSLKKKTGRPSQPMTDTNKRRTEDVLAAQFNVSPKTVRLDAQYATGLDKLSDSLKKDVLTRKVKVKKSDLIALGEFPASNERIQSGAELEQVLAQNIQQTALSSSTIKTPLEEPAQTLDQMIEHIIVIAQSLNKPSINQKEACLDLINQAQHLLTIIQERD